MPLKKITLKSGVNRENTRYTNEGGWYDCDKIRFRQGTPEKIGGWGQLSTNTYLGTCRSLWPWMTLGGATYVGTGTNLKYYVLDYGGAYNDITPLRATNALGANPFATTVGLSTVVVTDATPHGANTGDFVTFSGGPYTVNGVIISGNYQITVLSPTTYQITGSGVASGTGSGGGAGINAAYEIHTGLATVTPIFGWGSGPWSSGVWGVGTAGTQTFQVWNHGNFGEDLIYGPRGAGLYYWDSSVGVGTRGVAVSSMVGASNVPLYQNQILISDASRFVFVFGTNALGSITQDPMQIRWSDQESAVNWTPAADNQAGDIRLSHGSKIVQALQVKQEILVFTDTSLYSMQYVGPPAVWQTQLMGSDISIASDRAAGVANNVTYWMGSDKFYFYDGRVNNLVCDIRQYIFSDINNDQISQVFSASVEEFNEIWWFYPGAGSFTINKYAVYNYVEKVWYYGTMARTAWFDTSVYSRYPIAANYSGKLLIHEYGIDDLSTGTPAAISAYITSSEFDIDDGQHFAFIWRILPDATMRGSTATSPKIYMELLPLSGSGSGYITPASVGGVSGDNVIQSATVPIEAYTNQINVRVRCRQMSIKVSSSDLGVTWQLGSPRIDIRPDGRR